MATGNHSRRTTDVVNSEAVVWMVPGDWKRGGDRNLVVYAHGGDTNETDGLPSGSPMNTIARDYPAVCPNLGGIFTWGNDTFITRVGEAIGYGQGPNVGAKSGKVFLVGYSMGALICNWGRQNLSSVAGIILFNPAVNLAYFHDTYNSGQYTAGIDTAYGGSSAYTAALPTHNPSQYAAELADVPFLIFYSTDDNVVRSSDVTTFAANLNNATVSTHTSVHTLTNVNQNLILPWMNAHVG